MNLSDLLNIVCDKKNFSILDNYIDFTCKFLEWAENGFQAKIICQNEVNYQFWQYKNDGHFNISRPINSDIIYNINETIKLDVFKNLIEEPEELRSLEEENRRLLSKSLYTIQQCIGIALDALPAGKSNNARKLNGDLFERLIKLILQTMKIDCTSGVVKVPIIVDEKEQCKMSYQHDLIIKTNDKIKVIGSVKTSSKDRIDKIFIDKFLFNKLTETQIPHIAIFLNDVQRGKKTDRSYKISSTFLPGHFKGYTIKLNPLDGVYYCDIRPNMHKDALLKKHIKTIDYLFCNDIWDFVESDSQIEAEIIRENNNN